MNEPYRTQFEVRCAFNGFCKKALKYEASSAHRDVKRYQKHFVSFPIYRPKKKASFTRLTNLLKAKRTTIHLVLAVRELPPNC